MATVVFQKDRDIGGNIGRAFGGGLDQGFEEAQTQRQAQERSRRLNALMSKVQDAPDRKSALQLGADPEFSDLFQSMEQFQSFGQLVDDVFQGENVESVDFTRGDGSRGTAFLTAAEKQRIAEAEDQGKALSEFLGEDATLGFSADDQKSVVDIFSGTGRTIDQVPKSEFDPEVHLGENRFTEQGFKFKLEQDKERRLSGEKGKGESKRSDEQMRAIGNLGDQGITNPTDAQIAKEMSNVSRADKFSPRLATAFGMEQKGESFIEKFTGSGGAERFAAAQTALPSLIRAGVPPNLAFKASITIGNAIPARQIDLEKSTADNLQFKTVVKTEVRELNPTTDEGKQQASQLDPRKDVGKVFKHSDGFFMIYIGEQSGEPAFEVVEL